MAGIKGDIFILFNSIVNAIFVVKLPANEFLRQFLDLELDGLTILTIAGHTIGYLHLLGEQTLLGRHHSNSLLCGGLADLKHFYLIGFLPQVCQSLIFIHRDVSLVVLLH